MLIIPSVMVVVIFTFILGDLGAGNTANLLIQSLEEKNLSYQEKQNAEKDLVKRYGINQHVFYFSIQSFSQPEFLRDIISPDERNAMARLCHQYGNSAQIEKYYKALDRENSVTQKLRKEYREDEIKKLLIQSNSTEIQKLYSEVLASTTSYKTYIPTINFHGSKNRFHIWLMNLMKGDFGNSFINGNEVKTSLKKSLPWTILINSAALILILLISIPLGVFVAGRKGKWIDKFVSVNLFSLYSLPVFWVATLLLIFFAGGSYWNWFPLGGVGDSNTNFFESFSDTIWHLVLPVFCLVYPALAFFTRQVRSSVVQELDKDYALTAAAKGLNQNTILWRHAFRNALFPLITIMVLVLPEIINGSVVVESIFSIPGIGMKSFQAVLMKDYPFITSVIFITAMATLFASILADVAYASANPMVRFSNKNTD